MRWTMTLLIPFAIIFAAPVRAQDQPRHGDHPGGLFGKGPRVLLERFLGDATAEEKESLKSLGKEFMEGASQYLPQMRSEVMSLHEQLRTALTAEEQARVKEVITKIHALSIPEKIGLAQGLIGALNTPDMRSDIRLFFKGSPEERAPAGDRIARAAAAKFVAEMATRAQIADPASTAVLKAFDDFLDKTSTQRIAMRDLAQEKLTSAWAILTPEQKDRIKSALGFVRGWLEATAAPVTPAGGG